MIASDTTSSSTAIQLASKPGAGGGGGGVDGLQGCQIDGQFYMDGMQVKYKDTTITKLKYLFTVKAGFQVWISMDIFVIFERLRCFNMLWFF